MSYTVGPDGPAYETAAEALAVLPAGEQAWLDGHVLERTELEYLAHQEAIAYDPEEYP